MTGPYRARNPLLIAALHTIDAFAMLLPKWQKEVAEAGPLRVLVANWGHLGDVVTILPLLKFLEEHPRVEELGVLIGSWARPVLESSDIAAKMHVIDHWSLDRSDKSIIRKVTRYWARYPSLVKELRQRRYDVSIDTFSTFPSSHGITWSASIPRRIGFVSGGMGRCLTDPFNWVPSNSFVLEHQLELLKPLLGEDYPKSLPASYPGFEAAAPQHLLGFAGKPYIVIHMGPRIRGWVLEKWIALADTLCRQGLPACCYRRDRRRDGGGWRSEREGADPGYDRSAVMGPVRGNGGRCRCRHHHRLCRGTHCGVLRCAGRRACRGAATDWLVASQ